MSNVVSLSGFKCQAGSLVMHPEHGMVEVLGVDGWMRCIQVEHYVPIPVEAEDELAAERIDIEEVWVHVRELKQADLAKDIEAIRKRGHLLVNTMEW